MRYVGLVAAVTKMKSSMEVATEVGGANAIKPVMKFPAEFICKESIVTAKQFLLQVETKCNDIFDEKNWNDIYKKTHKWNKICDIGLNSSEICNGSSNLVK